MHIFTKPLFKSKPAISLRTAKRFVWCFLLLSYFLQVPFRPLSKFISVFSLVFLVLTYRDWINPFKRPLFCLYAIYIGLCIFISAFNPNVVMGKIFRFSEILFFIPLFFCIDETSDEKFYSKSFVRIAFLKAVVIFIIYGIVIKTGAFTAVRVYATQNGWGDIYSFGTLYKTRVQVQGNALLVMACFTAFYRKDKLLYKVALLAACLIAGNKAFLIGLFLFIVYFCISWLFDTEKIYNFDLKICFFLFCCLLAMPVLIKSVDSILKEKSDYSNVVRKDQAEVLLSGNVITGNGVGNTITTKTTYRDYTGNDYFELQTLYIINQIGIFGYLLFLVLTFGLCLKHKNPYFLCFVYFSYLAYSFFNPYCFDTTHMMVGFLICSVFSTKRKGGV